MNPLSPARTDPLSLAARAVGRFFYATIGWTSVLVAALSTVYPHELGAVSRAALIGGLLAMAALSLLAMRWSAVGRIPTRSAMAAVALGALLLTGVGCFVVGEGLRSPAFGFVALLVCAAAATTGPRPGATLATVGLLEVALLAIAEAAGWIGPAPRAATPLAMVVMFQTLLVGCAAMGGHFIARVLEQSLRAAAERERRFRGLLRLAADWYWEQDRHYAFTRMSPVFADDSRAGDAGTDDSRSAAPPGLDHAPWEVSAQLLGDDQIDAHRADLEAHLPFHGLLARQRDEHGAWRTVSVSGEPLFDEHGVFCGYWGVARDVSDEIRVQQAVTASETRYRELFTRAPSPLFLHRAGIVFDANDAAARLFGFPDAAQLNGFDSVSLYPAGTAREHALADLAALEGMALGEALPVTDHQIRSLDGRPLSVQTTAVRVDTSSGPANLSIFYDVTMRQSVESALRRSEAMLSHLFANSPDGIALAELESGRYAMVNPAFCRVSGYAASEVVGRTSTELGLWDDTADRDRLIERLKQNGSLLDMPAVFVAKSGARVSMLLGAGRFVMDRRDYIVIIGRDVTESERTRRQHAAILEQASIGIAFTQNDRFVQANPYFERMFGWEAGALNGQSAARVFGFERAPPEIDALGGPPGDAAAPFEIERRMRQRNGTEFQGRLLAQAVDRTDPSRGGTIWIAEDVSERHRLDAALAAARDAAEAASRAKSAFLANTSHEIRTPLNGLLGLARLAMQPGLPEGRRHAVLGQIFESAQGLAAIMSDVLDFSKIEAGKFSLEDLPFDLHATLHTMHRAYVPLAEVKALRLQLAIDPALPVTVRGDAVRVRQILANFITNAIKFTERGQVRIEAAPVAGGIRLAVVDTGCGLDLATQQQLFTPFSQGDSSTTRRFGGTGLGLSICRELARLMSGTVGVESRAGHGSTFWAELPLAAAAALPPEPDSEAEDLARLHGARVLVAEDNPVNMTITVAMLEHWGVEAVQAIDGRAAIEAVQAAADLGMPFHAVLMDVQMPVMGGHEAARELRVRHSPATLPIVALTAAALVAERDAALAAGMNDFLTKPIDATRLRRTLARCLARTDGAGTAAAAVPMTAPAAATPPASPPANASVNTTTHPLPIAVTPPTARPQPASAGADTGR